MIRIIKQNEFKTVPWKNGKGETTELAINEDASLANFDWRISIASVVENGVFSDFTGYQRNLILIEGNSIELCHDEIKTDKLTSLLDYATFNGGSSTVGTLPNGSIKDLNIITHQEKYAVSITTSVEQTCLAIAGKGLSFAYSLADKIVIDSNDSSPSTMLAQGDLLQISGESQVTVTGSMIILVHLIQK